MSRLAGNLNIATHTFRQTFRHGKANASAGGGLAALTVFHLIIHGEDFILLFLRDTDTGVFHFKVQHIASIVAHAHDHAPLLSEFDGVADQVPQNLSQTSTVSNHFMRQRQRRLHHKTQPFLLRLQTGQVFEIGKEAGKIDFLVIQLNFTALHFIHVDNIIEDIAQRYRRNVDRFQVFFLLRRQVGVEQNAAEANNAVERGTQFVADGRDKGGFVAAGALQRILIALAFGNIATKAHQAMAFTHAIVVRHFTDFEARFAPVRIIEPLLVGQRDVVTENFLIGFNNLCCRFGGVDIFRMQMNQLLFTLASQQLHRPVTAGKLFIFIAIENQIRRSIEERTQEGGLLFKANLRFLTLLHLNAQLLQRRQALGLGFFAIANFLIKL